MATDTQFRVDPPAGVKTANLREEPSTKSRVVMSLPRGQIVHLDTDRKQDGDWYPVRYIRGWMHENVVTEIDPE